MPGAYNNASGVATMIQTAEWLVQSDELPCDVIFAAFNTEDNDENGSSALSKLIEDQYAQIRMGDPRMYRLEGAATDYLWRKLGSSFAQQPCRRAWAPVRKSSFGCG